jgi:hypothetical protein
MYCLLLNIIIFSIIILSHSSSLTSLGGGANFEFRVLSRSDEALRSLPISTLSSQYARVQMRSAAGPSSTCFVPKVSSNDVSSGSTADDKDATKSARVRSVSDLLLGDDQSRCVFRQIGFWTFEVCAGLQVRQFRQHVMTAEHGMSASSSAPTTPLPDGSMGPQNLIGNFDQGNEEIIVTSTGELALRHIYANGADGRSATVFYICEPLNMDPAQTVDLLSVVESPTLTYTILVGVRNDAICGLIPSPSRLIAPFNRSCFEHIEGWWTYSICFGLYIRQFHAEQGTGKPVQESLIGNFDWARGEEFERGSLGSAPAITQHFNKGAACDIKNSEPREAFIRFECLPFLNDLGNAGAQGRAQPIAHVIVGANTLSLLSIKEAPSCVYTITIGSNSVCSHPEISASQIQTAPPPPTLVYCVMNDEEVDEIDDDELLI